MIRNQMRAGGVPLVARVHGAPVACVAERMEELAAIAAA